LDNKKALNSTKRETRYEWRHLAELKAV